MQQRCADCQAQQKHVVHFPARQRSAVAACTRV
jgi:hypothetical protein